MCQDFFQPTSWIPVSERTKERKDMLVTRWPKASTTFRVNFSHEEIPKNHRNFEANGWESPAFQLLESLMCSKIYLQQKKTCGQNIVGISTSCRERPTWKAVLILKSLLSLTSKLWEIHAAFTLVPACRKWFEWTNSAKIIKTLKEKSVWINSCWLCFGIYISYPDTQLRCSASIGPSTTVSDILRTTINSLGQRRLPYKVVNRIIYHTSLYKYAISMHVRIQYVHYLHQYAFQTSYQ